ncbi:rod shape-determining protein MreD [Pectinatus haikarae]|uniref:Rod shape-determining protein MreD n=1 Tax=Pectinatus haikarae TaxID=349096 RepID=A0ABT9Y545_9FIRM|nr:rod shape-determining protein MreD [Pectinatus haikarae]MDQ0202953.1 rod shape-determining protein MreD [Pectinatus haikarae]
MKKKIAWIAVFLAAYILQTSLLNLVSFHNINADLLLLLTVSYSLTHGFRRGAFIGFCSGLLQDVASGTFLGFNTLSKMMIGFGFGFMIGRVYEKKIILPVISSIVATAANYLISLIVILMLGYTVNIMQNAYNLLVIPLVYNLCFSYLMHRIVCWLKNKSFDE